MTSESTEKHELQLRFLQGSTSDAPSLWPFIVALVSYL